MFRLTSIFCLIYISGCLGPVADPPSKKKTLVVTQMTKPKLKTDELHKRYWKSFHAIVDDELYKDPQNYFIRTHLRLDKLFTTEEMMIITEMNKKGGYDKHGKYCQHGN